MTHPSSTTVNLPGSPSHRALIWPWVLMVVIFFASSQSAIAAPRVIGIDKIGHFTVYAWLGVLWARVPFIVRLKPLGIWTAVLVTSLYGIIDEFHQSFTPGRSVEFADWISDTTGALLAVAIYARWRGLRMWLEGAPFSRVRSPQL